MAGEVPCSEVWFWCPANRCPFRLFQANGGQDRAGSLQDRPDGRSCQGPARDHEGPHQDRRW